MAILDNRIKNSRNLTTKIRSYFILVGKFFILVLILLSGILLNLPANNRLSQFSLELKGNLISKISSSSDVVFAGINYLTNKLQNFGDSRKENQRLKADIAKLDQLLLTIDKLQAENKELKKLITVIDSSKNFNYKAVKLLGIAANPHSKTALINGGTNQGVNIDQIVVNSQGLIGRIIEISNNFSKVLLINDFSMKIPVTTLTSNEKAIIHGSNNLLKLKYLQDDHKAIRGEMVVTSGDGLIYPYGILVGVIAEVNDSEVIVSPSGNPYTTDMVAVIDIMH